MLKILAKDLIFCIRVPTRINSFFIQEVPQMSSFISNVIVCNLGENNIWFLSGNAGYSIFLYSGWYRFHLFFVHKLCTVCLFHILLLFYFQNLLLFFIFFLFAKFSKPLILINNKSFIKKQRKNTRFILLLSHYCPVK